MPARTGILVASVLAGVAILLPPAVTARLLAGAESPLLASLTTGFWVWKLLLFGHASALWFAARDRAHSAGRAPALADSTSDTRASRVTFLIVFAIAGIALALRLVGLGDGLWFDEIKMQVRYIAHPLGVILTTYDDQNQHLLYSACAKLSVLVFGEGAWALRFPAVVFGVASIWAVYYFGVRLTSRSEAVLAAGLLAVSYHHVWFSQNARGYTGLLLWTLVSSALFLDLLRNRDARRWALSGAYGLAIALALYTHLTAAVLPVSHLAVAGWMLWGPARTVQRRPAPAPLIAGLALAGTLSLQAYAPVLPQVAAVVLEPSLAGVTIAWKHPLWMLGEMLRGLSDGVPGGSLALILAFGVGAVGLADYLRRSSSATLTMLLPLVVTAVAITTLGHNLWPRFFFFGAGFAVLIGLRGLGAITGRFAGAGAPRITAGLAVLASIASLTTVPSAWGPKQDYDGAEAYIDGHAGPDDAIVAADMMVVPFDEYKMRGWDTIPAAASLEALESLESEHDRTWLIYSFPTSLAALHPDVWDRVRSKYRLAAEFGGTVRGGNIFVMVRP